jgi:hypothetical protein
VRLPPAATVALGLALCGAGCRSHAALTSGDAGPVAGASGAIDGGVGGSADAGAAPDAGAPDGFAAGFDPGWVGMRRLSDAEYARTIQDLLGLTGLDAPIVATFTDSPDPLEAALDQFDSDGAGAPISAARYEAYFTDAETLVQQAFASDALRARIVTCAPATLRDDSCTRTIVRAFGLHAWRRPLTDDEVDELTALVGAALGGGAAFSDAIEQAVVAMLVSESFLYRIELDPPPPAARVHAVTSYELASRLSYLLWSSLPDDALFALAASDGLSNPDTLAAQVTRMLGDARASGFVANFFGQWLGFRVLDGPTLDRVTPDWAPALQTSMATEAHLFVADFMSRDQGIGDLLTADVNFVDPYLGNLYSLPTVVPADMFTRIVDTTDAREGYLGLAALLTLTSNPSSTSPSHRGRWIVQKLLCAPVPAPPGNHPAAPTSGTPREQLQERQDMAACAACHALFEPVGIGLENFDEIGRLRASYADDPTTIIDDHGAMPDGTPYEGLRGLAALLAQEPAFVSCARREVLAYALGRPLTDADAPEVAALDARWAQAGLTMRGLLGAIVVDDLFRTRRAEDTP